MGFGTGGMNVSEIKKLAKELQDYTRVVGSHNNHIQSVANRLLELTEQPQLNENQFKIIKSWGYLKAGELGQGWTKDDELTFRQVFGQTLTLLPDELPWG